VKPSRRLFLEDVAVARRLVEDRLGEGTERHQLLLLGARLFHGSLHEPRARAGAASVAVMPMRNFVHAPSFP
jgi:hypothetical protein